MLLYNVYLVRDSHSLWQAVIHFIYEQPPITKEEAIRWIDRRWCALGGHQRDEVLADKRQLFHYYQMIFSNINLSLCDLTACLFAVLINPYWHRVCERERERREFEEWKEWRTERQGERDRERWREAINPGPGERHSQAEQYQLSPRCAKQRQH